MVEVVVVWAVRWSAGTSLATRASAWLLRCAVRAPSRAAVCADARTNKRKAPAARASPPLLRFTLGPDVDYDARAAPLWGAAQVARCAVITGDLAPCGRV